MFKKINRNMQETLISFETAKLAKEKGFDIPLYTSYINGIFHENEAQPNGYDGWDIPDKENWNKKNWVFTEEGNSCFGCKLDNIKYFEACSAPTQSVLAKWLREEHNIDVFLDSVGGKTGYFYVLQYVDSGNQIKTGDTYYSYEEALEIGLFETLKLIKK